MHPTVHSLTAIGRIGRYDILGRLATGGMAEIFLAREEGPHATSREVVVKRVLSHIAGDPKLKAMFLQEAGLCMRLKHTHVCSIYEFGEEDGVPFLAMEWVSGVSLASLIRRARERQTTLPVSIVVRIIADVAGALHHAHSARDQTGAPLGIVHRDVTPENLMIGFEGSVKLLDFGIAKAATQQDKTQAGVLKGKFAYMSPEQYRGEPLDGRSDVFSLGVCLWEALAGRPLYARDNEYETVAAIVLEKGVPSIAEYRPDLPEALEGIVGRAISKDRERRQATADDLQRELAQYLSASQQLVRPVDIARCVQALFPNEYQQGPRLETELPGRFDRGPQRPSDSTGAQPLDAIERLALGAEVDGAEESLVAADRRRRQTVGVAALILVLVTLAVAGAALWRGGPSFPETGSERVPVAPGP